MCAIGVSARVLLQGCNGAGWFLIAFIPLGPNKLNSVYNPVGSTAILALALFQVVDAAVMVRIYESSVKTVQRGPDILVVYLVRSLVASIVRKARLEAWAWRN